MLRHSLLLTAFVSLTLSRALAQHVPSQAHFPGVAVSRPAYATAGPALPTGLVPPAPVAAASPTVRAAAAYAPLLIPAASPTPPAGALPLPPRHNLMVAKAGPPYDLYQNLPEEFRKRTLPAVWAEPVALQLLRGALGR